MPNPSEIERQDDGEMAELRASLLRWAGKLPKPLVVGATIVDVDGTVHKKYNRPIVENPRENYSEAAILNPSELEHQPIPPGSVIEYACHARESSPNAPSYCRHCGAPVTRVLVNASPSHPCQRANQRDGYPVFPCPD